MCIYSKTYAFILIHRFNIYFLNHIISTFAPLKLTEHDSSCIVFYHINNGNAVPDTVISLSLDFLIPTTEGW